MRKLLVVLLLCILTICSPGVANAQAYCVPHSGDDIGSWVSDGLALADLPDDAGRQSVLEGQAYTESRYDPDVVSPDGSTVGLEQIDPTTWSATLTGQAYPYGECATDPVVSAAVRGELFDMGHFN